MDIPARFYFMKEKRMGTGPENEKPEPISLYRKGDNPE